jgi:hypothetical protein
LIDATHPPQSGQEFLESSGIAGLSAQQISQILPSAFWLPGWNFSSARAEHLPFYFWLIDTLRPLLIVDIVAEKPDNYLAFCQSVERLSYGAKCCGIANIFKRGSEDDSSSLREYHDMHFNHFSRLADATEQLLDLLHPRSIDLLHIGGRQVSKFSETDIRKLLDYLSSEGLILIDQPEHLGSSWRRFLEKRASFIINGKHGLLLSAANTTNHSKLSPLFNEAGNATVAASMRTIFMRLGAALRDHALQRDLAVFAKRLEISLADQSALADLLRDEKTTLEIEVNRQTSERHGLVARIAVLEPYVEQFRIEIIRLQERATHAQNFKRESEAENSRLRLVIADSGGEISRLQQVIADRDGENSRLHHVVADREIEIRSAVARADGLRQHVLHLENDLNRILQSTAWRVTAPFRSFLMSFPGTARVLRQGLKLLWWTVSFQLFSRLKQLRGSPALSSAQPPATLASASLHSASEAGAPPPQPANIEHNSQRIERIEYRIGELATTVSLERQRIDFALLGTDGLLDEIELYHKARAEADYRKIFDEAAPLVSICVATMNRSDLLIERCLNSLLSQSYRNIQIIVVGDHCTDDTGSRIARLRDDRILFRNLPTRGPYPPPGIDRWRVAGTNAMNAALSMCEGQFITHLDDDDSAAADRIETLVSAAQLHKADFCWHPFWCERKDGTWHQVGDGRFELGQITTGSIFYHRYFKKFPWNVYAYRTQEPGDWNRLRKIRSLRPNLHFVDRPLIFHYIEGNQPPFVHQHDESFLE